MALSKLIVVRHGKTRYTDEGIDLTEQGIAEAYQSGRKLSPELSSFDRLDVDSSPAPRAVGTAAMFLNAAHRPTFKSRIRREPLIRPVDIYNPSKFQSWDRDRSTGVYGEAWFTDPGIAEDTDYMEGRNSVYRRAMQFLKQTMDALRQGADQTGRTRCILAFTHFEVASNWLRELYTDQPFPSETSPGLGHAEDIHFILDHSAPEGFTIEARGRTQPVRFDTNHQLIPRDIHGTPAGD